VGLLKKQNQPHAWNYRIKSVRSQKNWSQVAGDEDREGDQEVEAENDAHDQDANGHEKIFAECLEASNT
jgi:hypothetical protein